MSKYVAALATVGAVILGLAYLPAASAGTPSAGMSLKTTTVAKAAANELRAGERLKAPKLGRHVKRYQWLRCGVHGSRCAKILGATHRFYVIRSADIGHVLRVREVLQGDTIATSQPTSTVGLPLPVNTAVPTITDGGQGGGSLSGPIVGDVLTGSNGTWKYAVAYTYQWEDCNASGQSCTAIPGATSSTYTLSQADVGDTVVFQVTAYNYQPAG